MADILETIIAFKRKEVEDFKNELKQEFLEKRTDILKTAQIAPMSEILKKSTTGIIAEFKRKSPSKGWINKDANPSIIPISYERNGASALSILTDSYYFGGSNVHIRSAKLSKVSIPILYKNFIIDEYQIYQAKLYGASAILLIASCLTKEECQKFINKAHELQLEVLLEMHTEAETEYAELGPDMCGINNRNLGSFETDVTKSFDLIGRLPADSVKVSESGLSDPNTVKQLRAAGYNGFLIGETFMRQPNPGLALNAFISQI
jgi:indole-3-glycerol phosphate synthase